MLNLSVWVCGGCGLVWYGMVCWCDGVVQCRVRVVVQCGVVRCGVCCGIVWCAMVLVQYDVLQFRL